MLVRSLARKCVGYGSVYWKDVSYSSVRRFRLPSFGGGSTASAVKKSENEDLAATESNGEDTNKEQPDMQPPPKGKNWDYNTELSALTVRLGHNCTALPSLKTALLPERTRSKEVWNRTVQEHSEPGRLSFLGRSVLQFYVCEHLYYSYPVMKGTMLQDVASAVANADALNEVAQYIGVVDLMRCGPDTIMRSNVSVVADVFCAVIGAVYNDVGAKAASKVVKELVLTQLVGKDLEEVVKIDHPRLLLHTVLATQKRAKPQSRLISESGRASHFPSFRVGVYSGTDLLGEGTGTSLRRAENEATLTALRSYFMKEVSTISLPSDSWESEEELAVKMRSISNNTPESDNS